MPVKEIVTPSGRRFKFGRQPMIVPHSRLRLRNYLLKSMPSPPPTIDYSTKAMPGLRKMLLNDQYGDCVPAWMCHATSIFTANAGAISIASDAEVEKIYEQVGGFNPSDPNNTDNGTDENTALAWWKSRGIVVGGKLHKIAISLAIDPNNEEEQKTAMWLFENLMYGVALPDAWVNPMPEADGWRWDVAGAPDPNNGHCFGAMGYGNSTFHIATWAMLGNITAGATQYYCNEAAGGQLFTVLSQEILERATMRAPSGVNWPGLVSDISKLR